MGPAMATVEDAKAQPKAVRPRFLIQFAFILNLLPKMENQSFEKLLKVRRALSFKLFPYNDISLAACGSVRMRKPLETVY
jgi:hypothetical protein